MIFKNLKVLLIIYFLNHSFLLAYENKIIAKIDNKVITSYELKNKILTTLMLSNEEINQKNINKTKPLVLNSLINLKIKENETKKYKIEVSQLEINNNLKTFAPDNLDNFIKKFESNNLNFEIFKKYLKTELAWRKLIYYLFNNKIKVNDSEINLELNKILKDSRKKIKNLD